MTGSGQSISDAVIASHFRASLEDGDYGLKPADARAIAQAAVEWAGRHAMSDPKLGSGQDSRAIFALAEGVTIGAMAWRDAEARASNDA